jgi:hypothetical protein
MTPVFGSQNVLDKRYNLLHWTRSRCSLHCWRSDTSGAA